MNIYSDKKRGDMRRMEGAGGITKKLFSFFLAGPFEDEDAAGGPC
jgi:hypothetical protein